MESCMQSKYRASLGLESLNGQKAVTTDDHDNKHLGPGSCLPCVLFFFFQGGGG